MTLATSLAEIGEVRAEPNGNLIVPSLAIDEAAMLVKKGCSMKTVGDVTEAVSEYNQKLQLSNIPKLLIYGEPGVLTTKHMVDWCMKNLSNLTTANIGAGIHYLQEDNPHAIGLEIAKWYESIPSS